MEQMKIDSARPKVSVVVPVYNAESYIEKCCRSLFEQTLDSMEYIFVDDCSPDNSIEIVKRTLQDYPHRCNQVLFLRHETNQRVARTRQDGVDVATGEYLIHCDSDDWTDKQMYEQMYNAAKEHGADIVGCNIAVEYGERSRIAKFAYDEETKENFCFDIGPIYGALYNKLVRRSIITDNNIRFYEGINMGEDYGVMFRCRFFSNKTVILPHAFYHYNQLNTASIVHNFKLQHCQSIVGCVGNISKFIEEQGCAKDCQAGVNYLKFQSKQYLLIYKDIRDVKLWRSIYPECNARVWQYDTSLYLKVVASLANIGAYRVANWILALKDKINQLR